MAVALTWVWMGALSLAWRQTAPAADVREPQPEALVRLTLPTPPVSRAPTVTPTPPVPRTLVRPARRMERAAPSPDTAGVAMIAASRTPDAPSAQAGRTAPALTRLLPSPSPVAPWYSARRAHNPFVRGEEASNAERDSILGALGPQIPELAARRVPTQSERDARAKEALLKMRLSGRILLVPPDNSGGIITASIPLPFLGGRGPSKVARHRDSLALAGASAIQDRLRQRADSLRRSRSDSTTKSLVVP